MNSVTTSQSLVFTIVTAAATIPITYGRYIYPEEYNYLQHMNTPFSNGNHHIVALAANPNEFSNAPSSTHNAGGNESKKPEPTTTNKSPNTTPTSDKKPTAASTDKKSTNNPSQPSSTNDHKPSNSDSPKNVPTSSNNNNNNNNVPLVSPNLTNSNGLSSITNSPTSSNGSSNGSSSNGGVIAGVIVGIVAIIGAVAAFILIRRKKRRQQSSRNMKPDPFTMGFGNNDTPMSQSYNNTNNYQYNAQNTMAQPYQQQQQPYQMHSPESYTTPPPPLSPLSDAPPYQQQYYSTQPITSNLEKSQPISNEPPIPLTTIAGGGYATMTPQQEQEYYQQETQQAGQPNDNPSTNESSIPQGSLGIFNVVSTYSPTLSDEIDIQIGDKIEILVEYDDGWCQGVNVTRGHAKGVFPRHCVEQHPIGSQQQQQQQQKLDGPPQIELENFKRVSSMYMSYN